MLTLECHYRWNHFYNVTSGWKRIFAAKMSSCTSPISSMKGLYGKPKQYQVLNVAYPNPFFKRVIHLIRSTTISVSRKGESILLLEQSELGGSRNRMKKTEQNGVGILRLARSTTIFSGRMFTHKKVPSSLFVIWTLIRLIITNIFISLGRF